MSVVQENGRLMLRFGAAFTGELEHWHSDTSRITWRDPSLGRATVTFTMAPRGEIKMMSLEAFAGFRRTPDPGISRVGN
jgi:hypothetical protein